jgi:hypothetical protein
MNPSVQPSAPNQVINVFKNSASEGAWFTRKTVLALVLLVTVLATLIPLLVFADPQSCLDDQSPTGLSDSARLSVSIDSVVKGTSVLDRNRRFATTLGIKAWVVANHCFSNVGNAPGSVASIIPLAGENVIEELVYCLMNASNHQTEMNILITAQDKLGEQDTAVPVNGKLPVGTKILAPRDKPFVIPMSIVNAKAQRFVSHDETVALTLTVKDYSPIAELWAKPQTKNILISDLKQLVEGFSLYRSTIKTVSVDGDQVNVRLAWACPQN